MLPALIMLDRGKLKIAFFTFIFLMTPIALKIYMSDFEYLVLMQLTFWIASFALLKVAGLFKK